MDAMPVLNMEVVEWIDVKAALPADHVFVLVCPWDDPHQPVFVGSHEAGDGWRDPWGDFIDPVTHWMPFPRPAR